MPHILYIVYMYNTAYRFYLDFHFFTALEKKLRSYSVCHFIMIVVII